MSTLRVEEYLEIIYAICLEKKVAKVSDIKKALGLSSLSSVTEMVKKLDKEKLVNYEKYRGVTLTKEGFKQAKKLVETHKNIEDLFKIINIESTIAGNDACLVEHVISDETAKAIKRIVTFLSAEESKDILERINSYFLQFKKTK
ncbi:MAG: metal-dependent transcriptional regulator [Candidatus Heimdallarchaeota archaeon]|nr:metal-dependent transcriptional regulator [Candidatus Heimdallarchaeota archaeon]